MVKNKQSKEERALGTGTRCESCGTVVFNAVFNGSQWLCRGCHYSPAMHGQVFPFVTTHINGRPVKVRSLWHLRKLEREYGVQSVAFNQDEKSFRDPPQQDQRLQDIRSRYRPVFGERLEEVRR